jgi:hypothetical protein
MYFMDYVRVIIVVDDLGKGSLNWRDSKSIIDLVLVKSRK